MKHIKTLLKLSLLLIIYTSCNQEVEKKSFFEHFKLKDVLMIDKTKFPYINNEIIYINPVTNDTFITYYVRDDNEIRLLGFGNNTTENTLCLNNFMNDYNIDHFLDYYYLNDDSVFVLANYVASNKKKLDYSIFLFNMKGKIKNSWDISKITGIDDNYFCVNSLYYMPNTMKYINGYLYCKTNIYYPPFKKFDEKKIPTELVLNIATNEGHFIYAMPKIYGEGNFYGDYAIYHTKAYINDSTFVISFPIDHNLYLYNRKGELLKKKICKSQYIKEFNSFEKGIPVSIENSIEADRCNAYYYQIVYDNINNLFYRQVFHKQNKLNENGELNNIFNKSFSIMVIDENLNIVGEYYIPPYHLIPYFPRINNQEYLHLQIKGNRNYIIRGIYEYMN